MDRYNQAPFTSPPSLTHYASRQCKATRCQGNKEEVDRFGVGALDHPPYEPDLPTPDFHLFRLLKHWMDKKKRRLETSLS
ncbi:hypothetical protein KIN20_034538 [Parelaphostrongylus tenuis]|uniref:Uncharacterized protein n=1 Tax=Parelaphostrongylus tenuis TaxID=148309 RepID=A0AAD5R9S9_PARTN|nr:hypothetical protein KIN20_034538 [Parelaphostrongylus tenuis]